MPKKDQNDRKNQPQSPLQQHLLRWRDCKLCHLCERRQKVVLFRGQAPCDLLAVGEAPGKSEDVLGFPFVGPAGQLLDQIITRLDQKLSLSVRSESDGSSDQLLKWGFTNIISCVPLDDDREKTEEPEDDDVKACSDRLREIVSICKPRLIICVGTTARDWLDTKWRDRINLGLWEHTPRIAIDHPAFILRQNWSSRGLMIQRAVITIKSALERLSVRGIPTDTKGSVEQSLYGEDDIPF